jgi:hypothetical protein
MLRGMNQPEEPHPAAVDAVRMRLRALADAAGVPEPPLSVDVPRREDRLPHVREIDRHRTVVVPRSLLEAPPARQLWELAACLGRWTSPVPDQRRRLSGIVLAVLLAALVALIIIRPTSWIWITPILLYPIGAWLLRWERRAMDDAGRQILARAGHRPAEIARHAFGSDPSPPALRALLTAEPSPHSRIVAAETDRRADPAA